VSASRDYTVRVWAQQTPPSWDSTIKTHGKEFVNSLAIVPPSSEFPEGLIVSGGKDQIIDVRTPSKGLDDDADALLIGHGNNVCALDVSQDGKYIVSGGWDFEARLWEVGKWGDSTVLQGHSASVWAVLAYDGSTIVTGCADKQIRVFSTSGQQLRTIQTPEVVRALCRLPPNHPSGAHFASAGNDAVIRLWTLGGKQVAELHGHENFIYSLAVLPNGGLVSAGEDRTVRIWENNTCIQTITHPAVSVWTVATCANGDFVTGASDKLIRIFTRDSERYASAAEIQQLNDDVKGSSIPQQAVPDINKEKLPGPEFLTQRSGTKEGQVQMILEANGNISAYQWSGAANEWLNVGTVVDSAGSGGRKVSHKGKEYDYVFDVDIEDGKPPLKLAYNLNQNHYEAARKFIEDNELPLTYLDQVANFITQNTQGATLGQSSNEPGADPWGSESRYRPGDANEVASRPAQAPAAPKIIPQKDYLPIASGNHKVIFKKLQEFNQALISDGQKGISLNPSDVEQLSTTVSAVEKGNGKGVDLAGVELLVKAATQWPVDKRLPALDLLRLVLVFNEPTAHIVAPEQEFVTALSESGVFSESSPPNNTMMAIRCLSNLLQTPKGRHLASTQFDAIHPLVSPFLTSPNRNLIIALTTLYINYAVLLTSENNADRALSLLDDLSKILTSATDSEAVYRALVATGTLLCLGPDFCEAGRDILNIGDAVKQAEGRVKEPRIRNVVGEIREKLRG
jgi:phospholipase A-2-activating protein